MKKTNAKHFIEVESNSGCKLLSEYKNCKQKLLVKCKCGNTFKVRFDNFKHKNKRCCNECSLSKKKLSYEHIKDYVSNNMAGYKLLDIKEKRKNNRWRYNVHLKCGNKEHPSYWVNWQSLLRGNRCSFCYHGTRRGVPSKWNKENTLKLLEKHNLTIIDKDYKFNNADEKIKCLNADGYIVNVLINSLYSGGFTPHVFSGNPYAIDNLRILLNRNNLELVDNQVWKGVKSRYAAITTEGYIVDVLPDTLLQDCGAAIFHSRNKYTIANIKHYCKLHCSDYELVSEKYINKKAPLIFKYVGNEITMSDDERYFESSLDKFIYGNHRHPMRSLTKGETKIKKWLKSNNIKHKAQYTFEDCANIRPLRFDFATFDNNDDVEYLIEFQGIQHYEVVRYFGGNKAFLQRQENDKIKRDYCEKNKLRLIEIPYTEYDNIELLLEDLFNQSIESEYRKYS